MKYGNIFSTSVLKMRELNRRRLHGAAEKTALVYGIRGTTGAKLYHFPQYYFALEKVINS